MMNILELAQARYSVRGYSEQNPALEDIEYIMECARMAPSAVNKQPWKFYVCQTSETLDNVRKCYPREWFNTPQCVIICCICHDEEWIRPNDGHTHGIVDISIAAEHICLAATERGLGSCWVCNFDTQLCHELFEMPETQEPAVLIPIGYATTEPTEKKRKAACDIITYC